MTARSPRLAEIHARIDELLAAAGRPHISLTPPYRTLASLDDERRRLRIAKMDILVRSRRR